MNEYFTHTLSCGLRLIVERKTSPVLYCGYVICAGTRHEEEADSGMAHFIEHNTFKGTKRRRACHITNGLERVGGDLNAYTTKQETVYYATVLRDDFARAADLLTDIVFHSTYPQTEIDKEVEVICDEIDSYKDSPSELIFDEFEAMMYAGQPLGRDILGSAERLRQYTTADALRFTQRYYRPENAVFYVYGDIDPQRVVRTLERLLPASDFVGLPALTPLSMPTPIPCAQSNERVVEKSTHQAHVLIGGPTFAGTDERRFALILLNNMLGGPGMNSRLNLSLREKAGLVYSVDAYLNTYPDTGFWNVYFGCDAHDVKRCRRLLERELLRFIEHPLTPAQLSAAKKQLRGQIGISTDASEGYALALGKTFAHYNRHRSIEGIIQSLNAVTAQQLQQVAEEVYSPNRLTTLVYR
ncbi:MAG: pitrilysin family protein [Prevotellamassilia sp.]|nr:pitrilysin family protein [Prevotellamassilia sp.]